MWDVEDAMTCAILQKKVKDIFFKIRHQVHHVRRLSSLG